MSRQVPARRASQTSQPDQPSQPDQASRRAQASSPQESGAGQPWCRGTPPTTPTTPTTPGYHPVPTPAPHPRVHALLPPGVTAEAAGGRFLHVPATMRPDRFKAFCRLCPARQTSWLGKSGTPFLASSATALSRAQCTAVRPCRPLLA